MCAVKSSRTRERIREFTKPAHFETTKRRRIERLSYRGIRGESCGSFIYLPSPFVASSLLPCISFAESLFPIPMFSRSLISPSPFLFLARFSHSFVVPFLPFRPQIPHPPPSTADTERAYACVHVVTTYYYALLLTLAYYYEQWRIDLSPRPSPCEQPRDFF